MYLGHLAQSHPLLPSLLQQVLARLAGEFVSLKTQACGRYLLEGDKLFYLVQEGRITSYNVCYTKLLRAWTNLTGTSPVAGQAWLKVKFPHWSSACISYNFV